MLIRKSALPFSMPLEQFVTAEHGTFRISACLRTAAVNIFGHCELSPFSTRTPPVLL